MPFRAEIPTVLASLTIAQATFTPSPALSALPQETAAMRVPSQCSIDDGLSIASSAAATIDDARIATVLAALGDRGIEIKFVPEGQPIDSYRRGGFRGTAIIDATPIHSVTPAMLREVGAAQIQIDGTVKQLRFEFSAASGVVPPERDREFWYQDRFSNYCRLRLTNEGTTELTVMPAVPFLSDDSQVEPLVPLPVELSRVGLPDLESFVVQRAESPVIRHEVGSNWYAIYSNLPHAEVQSRFGEQFSVIFEHLQRTEEFFGIQPGELVAQAYIVRARSDNAFFSMRNPRAIVLHDQCMITGIQTPYFVQHETIHLLDFALGLSRDEFQSFFSRAVREPDGRQFLFDICESAFIPGLGAGGHAHDNASECFASLINGMLSLETETWELLLAEKIAISPSFGRYYLEALLALRAGALWKLAPHAPIVTRSEAMIDFLHQQGFDERAGLLARSGDNSERIEQDAASNTELRTATEVHAR